MAAGTALSFSAFAAHAQDKTDVSFVLDWAWQAMHGPFLIALEKGYYEDEGLNVTIDRGFGSGDTISKVAAAAYDIGFAEGTGLFKFNADNPEDKVLEVMVINDQSPTGVISMKETGISEPADLVGKTISATQNEATVTVWPVVAKLHGLSPDDVEFLYVEPNLRDAMVLQGQASATFGFSTTTVLNMVLAGVDLDDIAYSTFAEWGVKPYSSGILVKESFAAEHPDVVKGFVAATMKGLIDMLEDPTEGLELLKKREPLVDLDVEAQRWELAKELSIVTPDVIANGISSVSEERMATAAAQMAEAYGLDIDPAEANYFDGSFLPPLEERQVPDAAK
ncbi:ABC transporter substrate-binding protein [Acuticoccus yangtzensis]|uniref:ABC transporter substrate-binding protein n=1 Tax=Acuticoccus yangtzensis TaxID=1443441 RepID=UPI0009495541|nr:ABC transporter substrate-binding protein [Acuticoccus yangtzensis]